MEDKPEISRRSRVPSTLETLRLEPDQARRLALESTSDALPTNPVGQPPPRPQPMQNAAGKHEEVPSSRSASATTRPPPPPPAQERSTATPSVSPLAHLLEGRAGEWKEVPSEPKIRVEDEATRPDLRAIRRPIQIARDGGFDEDQPTQPARHLSGRGARAPQERKHAADPRLLLVGFPEGLELAVCQGLKRQSIRVVVGSPAMLSPALLERVDFLVLFGDPRGIETQACLGRVSKLRLPELSGVILVSDDTGLPARVLALRHGATSVIPRSASVGLLVERIAHVAWGVELSDEQACEREATVEELVGTLAEELENRLRAPGESSEPRGATRLVFSAARELPRLIDDMVQRVGIDIERVEHWDYELESRGSRAWLEEETQPLSGTRVALLDDDAMRADGVAHELRERGAHVLVVGSQLGDVAWARLARFDPMLLVFDSSRDEAWRRALKERQGSDPSLHQAARVGVDLAGLWKVSESFPNTEPVVRELNRVVQRQREILDRLRAGEQLVVAGLGISLGQLLRVLAGEGAFRLEVDAGERRFRAWLADGVLVGTTEERLGAEERRVSEGPSALSGLLECREGTLRVAVAQPSAGPPNLITPVDVALGQALAELRSSSGRVRPAANADSSEALAPPSPPLGLALPAVSAQSAPPHPQTQLGEPQANSDAWSRSNLALRPAIDPVGFRRKPARRGWLVLAAALSVLGLGTVGLAYWLGTPGGSESVRVRVDANEPSEDTAGQRVAAGPPQSAAGGAAKPSAGSALAPQPEAPSPAEPAALRAGGGPKAASSGQVLATALDEARADSFSVRGAPVADCAPSEASVTAGQAIAQARRALMSGKLEAATLAYCSALALLPEDAQLMTELARVFLQRGAGEQAVKWARRAYELAPKTLNQVLLGDALALDGQFVEAKQAWSDAWKIRSQSTLAAIASAHFHTANRAVGQRDYAKAERFLRRVALLDSSRGDAPLVLARVLREVSSKQGMPRHAEAKGWALRAAALTKPAEKPDDWRQSLELVRDTSAELGETSLSSAAASRLAAVP